MCHPSGNGGGGGGFIDAPKESTKLDENNPSYHFPSFLRFPPFAATLPRVKSLPLHSLVLCCGQIPSIPRQPEQNTLSNSLSIAAFARRIVQR